MINTIVEILATTTEILFLIWFIPQFNGVSWRRKIKSIGWAVALLCYQLIADNLLQGFDLLYMVGVLLFTICFALSLTKHQRLWAILSALIYVIVLMLSGSLAYSVFSLFIENTEVIIDGSKIYLRIMYICVGKIVQFAFFRLVLLIFRKGRTLDLKNGFFSFSFTILTALGLGALMKIATDGDFEGMDFLILLIAVVLILLNIILYVMIYQLQSLLKSQYELRLMRERIDFERSRIDEANLIWENIRKTKHDLKNHFAVIKGKLDAGEGEACKEYINQLYATVENMGNLIRSGNSIIDYLINSKLSGVENVNVIISGYVGDYDDIEDVDLASIIGNILDNAVEAQNQVDDEKRILLHFGQKNSNRVIICKNFNTNLFA